MCYTMQQRLEFERQRKQNRITRAEMNQYEWFMLLLNAMPDEYQSLQNVYEITRALVQASRRVERLRSELEHFDHFLAPLYR